MLIRLLADDAAHVEAWNALSRYGAGVLDVLVDAFRDPETDETVRRRRGGAPTVRVRSGSLRRVHPCVLEGRGPT